MNWAVITLATIWALLLPYVAQPLLNLTDTLLVRGLLLVSIAVALTLGPVEGGVVLFAVGLTFLERNRRKLAGSNVRTRLGNDGVNQVPNFLESVASEVGIGGHVDRQTVSETAFVPKEDMGSNDFQAVAGSSVRDAKSILATQPLGAAAIQTYERLFSWWGW